MAKVKFNHGFKIGGQIKIGKVIHIIQKGDYLYYNGSCYMLNAGDGRTLHKTRSGLCRTNYTYITLTKRAIKNIPWISDTEFWTYINMGKNSLHNTIFHYKHIFN